RSGRGRRGRAEWVAPSGSCRVQFVRPHPLRPSPRYRAIDLPPTAPRPDRAARGSVPSRAFGEAQRDSASAEAVLKMMTSERSEEHTSELQSLTNLVCRLLLEKKN